MSSLKQEVLLSRLEHFWGFGQYDAEYWFIGMEEGGGDELQEVSKRLLVWEQNGSPELIDNYEYHLGISEYGYENFFEGKIRLQNTWAKLIRAFLNIENPDKDYTVSDIKEFQAHCWGRGDSNNCLLDIFPLPSPSASKWNYDKWCGLPILRSRDMYKTALRDKRINKIKERIATYNPKVVIFYAFGDDYLRIWEQVSEIEFTPENRHKVFKDKSVYLSKREETIYVVTYQPSAVWNNQYWDNVGKFIHAQL